MSDPEANKTLADVSTENGELPIHAIRKRLDKSENRV